MKKNIIIIALFTVSFLSGWYLNNKYAEDHLQLNVAYFNYYQKCEALLDSIAVEDESFMDATGETDEYCDYMEAKQHLDSLRVYISKKEAQ